MDDVCLYGAERFVSDHDEDLLLLLQVDEVTEPRLLSQSAGRRSQLMYFHFDKTCRNVTEKAEPGVCVVYSTETATILSRH